MQDLTMQFNEFGSQLIPDGSKSAPTVRTAGSITDDQAVAVYADMVAVAERHFATDPQRLEQEVARIRAHCEAAGCTIPDTAPEPDNQVFYDRFNHQAKLAATQDADGYPAALATGQLELFRAATKDAHPDPSVAPADIAAIETWLKTAAAPGPAAELLDLAKKSALICNSLRAYASAAARFTAGRPK